jgi:hypothetical protein
MLLQNNGLPTYVTNLITTKCFMRYQHVFTELISANDMARGEPTNPVTTTVFWDMSPFSLVGVYG